MTAYVLNQKGSTIIHFTTSVFFGIDLALILHDSVRGINQAAVSVMMIWDDGSELKSDLNLLIV